MKKITILFLIFFALFLISCDSPASTSSVDNQTDVNVTKIISFNGRVVDGYVSGAVVCADLNLNTLCDLNESTAATSTTGYYTFSNLDVSGRDFISLMAKNGTDTATNKPFEGEIRKIVSLSSFSAASMQYVTPLTDLVATSFLNTTAKNAAALQSATNNVFVAYPVGESLSVAYISESPMSYVGVFGVSQEIQQTKLLMEEVALKTKGTSLTSLELKQLRREIKQAITEQIATDKTKNFANMVTRLESIASISIAENVKTFFTAQMANIEFGIDSFAQKGTHNPDPENKLTIENLNSYQVALESMMDNIVVVLDSSYDSNATIGALAVDIDIFTDTNTTDTNTTDTNTTTIDTNMTTISFSGMMADGYISAGTVCIDINFNGLCDGSEPMTTTSAGGNFAFSNVSVDKNLIVPIIGHGGKDTSTDKSFIGELEAIISIGDINNTADTVISPFSDLVATTYSESTTKNLAELEVSLAKVANSFSMTGNDIQADPMQNIDLFLKSQQLQQIRYLIELVVVKAMDKTLTETQKKELRTKIKKALASQIVGLGYDNLNISNVLTLLEVDPTINKIIPNGYRSFVISQIANVQTNLDALAQDQTIHVWTLPRIQVVLEDALANSYTNLTYVDVNLTSELITNSMFDQTDAIYDKDACTQNNYYTNALYDSDVNRTVFAEDTQFGLIINFHDTFDLNETAVNKFTLYYPNLIQTKINEEPVTIFKENYYFSFNKAWATQGDQVYIQTPVGLSGYYGCYKAVLDSTQSTNIELIKVYRYTDL